MQLKRIHLNGFKSFVDPTTIVIRSRLNAVVGPNGCGKSNIVDAIRWVTGEMSAKQLRGQSMADVIFNGTSTRKPLGKASVELIFDNEDRRIGGEYAGFSEIAIRREVVREGQSNYFINSVPARRRDLIDLFLGTGLGPRSYAIIEQGMVAQLVEAKPDEMRAHFEEVAGISKYRERRRETETRIRHTQENLDRLNDVREELEKQLRHLQRQSKTAEHYQSLQAELRQLQAEIKVLQWQQLETENHEKAQMMSALLTERESFVAEQRETEKILEKLRLQLQESHDERDRFQKKFYELGSDIGRLEQQIHHKHEQLKAWKQELTQSAALFEELGTQSGEHEAQIRTLNENIQAVQPKYAELQKAYEAAHAVLEATERNMREAQNACDQAQLQISALTQQSEIAKNNISHYETQLCALRERKMHIEQQLSTINSDALSSEAASLIEQIQPLHTTISENRTQLTAQAEEIQQRRSAYQKAQLAVADQQGVLQKLEAEQISLSALQKPAMSDHHSIIQDWLLKNNLEHQSRLGKILQVAAGWERAVESLLNEYFGAICVEVLPDNTSYPSIPLTLLEKYHSETNAPGTLGNSMLSDILQNCAYIPSYFRGVYLSENCEEAFALRSRLAPHESLLTRDAYWIGKHWIKTPKTESVESGFLAREKQLKALEVDIVTAKQTLKELLAAQVGEQQLLQRAEAARDAEHQAFRENTERLAALQVRLNERHSRISVQEERQLSLTDEIAHIETEITRYTDGVNQAQRQVTELSAQHQAALTHKEKLLASKITVETALIQAREDAQRRKQHADEWQIRLHADEKQLAVLKQSHDANQRQLTQMRGRRSALEEQIQAGDQPLEEWNAALQTVLAERVSVEESLRATEKRFYDIEAQSREQETKRESIIQSLTMMQEQQQALQLSQQGIRVRQETLQEQLCEMQCVLSEVRDVLPPEAEVTAWEAKSCRLHEKIERLGPINLAAIQEHQTVSERKTYLDQQMTDLQEALEILQNAIRKIDKETRHLFKDTFDQINQHFQKLFPRIFGGGQSELVLTEEDLLTTGIIVRAQPPGKRNATIHMLSGGEKTLTAIALMFAMFHINPAPFCVLDEVDAPLDDLNVSRYCQLIKEMSQETQFIVISHNKLTIESADHLMGVTMQEPGVSRIVSVDMQEAVSMVEEG